MFVSMNMCVLPTTMRWIELVVMVQLAIVGTTFVLMFERRLQVCVFVCMTIEMHILIRYDIHVEHAHVYTYYIMYGMYNACVYDKHTHTHTMYVYTCICDNAWIHIHTHLCMCVTMVTIVMCT